MVLNQSGVGECNLVSVWFRGISGRFLCVYLLEITGRVGTVSRSIVGMELLQTKL